ncbi:6074_t:CDS:2, partial [Gigaspora margarita]
ILDLTNQSSSNILALLVACDELMLDKLVNHVQKHLINQESSWLQENIIFSLLTVLELQSCKEIQDYIMITICKNPKPFFELKEFPALNKDIILSFVKRDDMDIEEIDIGNILIPEDIYEDLVAYLMANVMPKFLNMPSRCGSINIDSVIIKRNKAAVITNWIEKRSTFTRKPFYQFILTYRVTRDGFNQNTFNAKNQNNVILELIEIKDSKKIIGGYSPLGFKSYNSYRRKRDKWESTNDSFIFCFGDKKSSTILSRIKNSTYAIYSYSGSGMNFGNSDLVLNGQNSSCSQSYYEN